MDEGTGTRVAHKAEHVDAVPTAARAVAELVCTKNYYSNKTVVSRAGGVQTNATAAQPTMSMKSTIFILTVPAMAWAMHLPPEIEAERSLLQAESATEEQDF